HLELNLPRPRRAGFAEFERRVRKSPEPQVEDNRFAGNHREIRFSAGTQSRGDVRLRLALARGFLRGIVGRGSRWTAAGARAILRAAAAAGALVVDHDLRQAAPAGGIAAIPFGLGFVVESRASPRIAKAQ